MQSGYHNQSIALCENVSMKPYLYLAKSTRQILALRGTFLKAGFMWFAVFMLVISLLVSSAGWAAAPASGAASKASERLLANMVEFYAS